jgi:hypothetical protein
MQLTRRAAPLSVLLLVLATNPAHALCALVVLTPGTLLLSADGIRLSSDETGALPATMTVASIGPSTITVGAPSVIQSPPGHNTGSDFVEVAYEGTGLLSQINHGYTSTQTQATVPNLGIGGLEVLTIDNRITNTSGFDAGTYQTRTVITCS